MFFGLYFSTADGMNIYILEPRTEPTNCKQKTKNLLTTSHFNHHPFEKTSQIIIAQLLLFVQFIYYILLLLQTQTFIITNSKVINSTIHKTSKTSLIRTNTPILSPPVYRDLKKHS